ncbi:MAG: DUF885 domain-containing protein [Chitinophagaceae bacterium]
MKRIFLLYFISIAFVGCNNSDKETSQTNKDEAFQKLSDDFLAGYFAWRPQLAVSLGFHEYDGKVTDYSKASIDAEVNRLKEYDQKLDSIDTASLSTTAFYDYRILKSNIKNEIFNFEEKNFATNPMYYAGALNVNLYVKRDYAPIDERLKHIITTAKATPAVFAAAKANLQDSLPKPYIETAISIAEGSVSFMKGDMFKALSEVKDDSLVGVFINANHDAIDAIEDFISWLKKDKLPKATSKYAIGTESYKKMLLYGEDIDLSPEKILEIGMAELKKEQERFNSAAWMIDSTKKPIDVLREVQKEHPSADSLIPDAAKHLEMIRQFLIDKNIVTMPSEVRVQVKETPQYARATSTASMDVPGPFEKATEAYYYITPVDKKWTAKQQEDWLSQFDFYTTDNVSVHEAYPGHYTQFLHLNYSKASKIQKIFGSYAFTEGWAHYCESMMIDEGFGNTGDPVKAAKYKLAQSGDALLRICRLCVSVKMHCQGMTLDEGTKFFINNWYQGEKPSYQEALRGTFDPGYLFYTVGKLQLLKLREDYKKQEGANFSIKKFHDEVLDHGMAPVRMLREILLKDKSTWDNVL